MCDWFKFILTWSISKSINSARTYKLKTHPLYNSLDLTYGKVYKQKNAELKEENKYIKI